MSSRMRGFSVAELLVTMVIVTLVVVALLLGMNRFFGKHRLDSAATQVRTTVLRARMSALKEKTSYRLLVHDEDATTPNRLELQRREGGSWVSLVGEVHAIPEAVSILGSGSTNSMDDVTVNSRGACGTGKIYLNSEGDALRVITIEATCLSDAS